MGKNRERNKHEVATKHSVDLTEYEYKLLTQNKLIATVCQDQLESATESDGGIELWLTLRQLEELTGFVAAESNHARSKRQRDNLGEICDYLENTLCRIKRYGS